MPDFSYLFIVNKQAQIWGAHLICTSTIFPQSWVKKAAIWTRMSGVQLIISIQQYSTKTNNCIRTSNHQKQSCRSKFPDWCKSWHSNILLIARNLPYAAQILSLRHGSTLSVSPPFPKTILKQIHPENREIGENQSLKLCQTTPLITLSLENITIIYWGITTIYKFQFPQRNIKVSGFPLPWTYNLLKLNRIYLTFKMETTMGSEI